MKAKLIFQIGDYSVLFSRLRNLFIQCNLFMFLVLRKGDSADLNRFAKRGAMAAENVTTATDPAAISANYDWLKNKQIDQMEKFVRENGKSVRGRGHPIY